MTFFEIKFQSTIMRLKPALFTSAILLAAVAFCNISTGTPDPCEEAYNVLASVFPVDNGGIHIRPSIPGRPHPRLPNFQGKEDQNWRMAASYLRFNCPEYAVESLAVDQDERFYDDGVTVGKRPAQSVLSPPPLSKETSVVMTTITAVVAFLGIGALGIGTRKSFA